MVHLEEETVIIPGVWRMLGGRWPLPELACPTQQEKKEDGKER
jgi:hypothetical protein